MSYRASRWVLAAASLVLVAGCTVGASGYGDPVNGLRCDATGEEPVRARVAVHLVSGPVPEPVTMGVGSTGSCNYPVRTEDEDGIVIVRGDEAAGTATLDDFLTIWEYAIPAGSGGGGAHSERPPPMEKST